MNRTEEKRNKLHGENKITADEILEAESGWKGYNYTAICDKNCPRGYNENTTIFIYHTVQMPYCEGPSCIYAPHEKSYHILGTFKSVTYDPSYRVVGEKEIIQCQQIMENRYLTSFCEPPSFGWDGKAYFTIHTYYTIQEAPKTKLLKKNLFDKDWNIYDHDFYIYQGKKSCGKVPKHTTLAHYLEFILDNPCVQVSTENRYGQTSRKYITVDWTDLKRIALGTLYGENPGNCLNDRLLNTPRKSLVELSKELETKTSFSEVLH